MKKHTQQTLALAGLTQAAFLVDQLARHGLAAQDKLSTCLESLFVTNPKSTVEVYGSVSKLKLGLQVMEEIFISKEESLKNPEVMRYLIGMVYLEVRLAKREDMLNAIAKGLDNTQTHSQSSSIQLADNPEVIEQLARLYQQTISTLSFRIQVQGNPQYLKNPSISNTIRAVLLAGIRSTVLWHQLGGRRWHFLLMRRRISRDIQELLRQA
ncbi:MAG: lysogenization regulator HflD [Gammaproteobacteria bacterium]|nr:lysogenization regulator HflD [Gammaproteobacteria bacterium]MAY01441.1 lysogenization regulator HflD [Gammaproteobacteria bacterium]|tara:strand:+ start:363 stop:995 length:633 start_codon:yes stop_codon:yes gene_type:complete